MDAKITSSSSPRFSRFERVVILYAFWSVLQNWSLFDLRQFFGVDESTLSRDRVALRKVLDMMPQVKNDLGLTELGL